MAFFKLTLRFLLLLLTVFSSYVIYVMIKNPEINWKIVVSHYFANIYCFIIGIRGNLNRGLSNFFFFKRFRSSTGYPLKIVVEIGGIFEAEGIGYVCYAPVCVLQKGFCFGGYTFCNMHRCRLAGNFLY